MKFKERIRSLVTVRRIKGFIFLALSLAEAAIMMHSAEFLHDASGFLSILFGVIAVCYIFITPDMRRRVIKKIETVLIRFTQGLFNLIRKVIDKFSFSNSRSYRGARMAENYRDVSERIGALPLRPAKRKYKKYKNMDNIEKVRFLYEKKITASVRRGAELYECMTPNETGRALIEGKYMKQSGICLIDAYNEARYNSEAVISDETVARVKEV